MYKPFNLSLSIASLLVVMAAAAAHAGTQVSETGITHGFLATGAETYIMSGDGKVQWTYPANTRDGWVLPDGHVLLALTHSKKYPGGAVVEVTRDNKIVFQFKGTQGETHSVQPLADGHVLLTEGGPRPRLIEVDRAGKAVVEFPLQCQVPNVHMQTRMARKLADGTYLVPHLLDFAVKQYDAHGKVLSVIDTTVNGDRKLETWPFTAIRLDNGHTLIGCTHGNRVIETDAHGKVVWQVTNDDLPGAPIKDACGVQRLPNGHTVFTSYAARANQPKLIEVDRDKKIVWQYVDDKQHGIHDFQILDTNGKPIPDPPLK